MKASRRRIRLNERYEYDVYTEWYLNENGYYVAREFTGLPIEVNKHDGVTKEQTTTDDTDTPGGQQSS